MTRTQILHALDAFLESRPGFDLANYQGAPQAYRADYRRAYQHLQDGRALMRAVSWRDGIDADTLARAKHHRIDFRLVARICALVRHAALLSAITYSVR